MTLIWMLLSALWVLWPGKMKIDCSRQVCLLIWARMIKIDWSRQLVTKGTDRRTLWLLGLLSEPKMIFLTKLFPFPESPCQYFVSQQVCLLDLKSIQKASSKYQDTLPWKGKKVYIFSCYAQSCLNSYQHYKILKAFHNIGVCIIPHTLIYSENFELYITLVPWEFRVLLENIFESVN